jgi:hypothetical protein
MEELKHETDLLAPQLGQRIFAKPGDIHIVDDNLAVCRRVETGDEPEQRRLAAT